MFGGRTRPTSTFSLLMESCRLFSMMKMACCVCSPMTQVVRSSSESMQLFRRRIPDVDPDSRGGQHLMCHTEFHCHKECQASRTIARRTKEDNEIPQAKLITGMLFFALSLSTYNLTLFFCQGFTDGTLSALTPVDEGAFKRLHFLQGQLLRNVQHVAGLNPRVYR